MYKKYQFFLILWARESYFSRYQKRFLLKICRKCDSSHGSAPDPIGGAHDTPPNLLVSWGVDTPPHTPPHLSPQCLHLRRLDHRAPRHQILATRLVTTTF